jgi:hypothetical protein
MSSIFGGTPSSNDEPQPATTDTTVESLGEPEQQAWEALQELEQGLNDGSVTITPTGK